MKSVFSNVQFQVEQMITEGDFVFSRAMTTGTHIGEFMGFLPPVNLFALLL